MFDEADKFRLGTLALEFADMTRRRLPDVVWQLKLAYLRALREASESEPSIAETAWSDVAKLRRDLEEATYAQAQLNLLLGD